VRPSRSVYGLALGVCALLGVVACSNSNGAKNPTMRPGTVTPGDKPGTTDPTPIVDAGTPSGTVVVTILSPMTDSLLSTNGPADVSARITIDQGTDVVDPATVRMSLSDAAGQTLSAGPLVGPVGVDEFRGRLSLAGLKSGEYTITVTARSSTGAAGQSTVKIKLDGGPSIIVLSPIPGRHYKQSLIVQLVVDGGDFGPITQADITATIAGRAIPLAPSGPPNQWRATFDLTMPVMLEGDQLFTVSAKNKNGTRTELRFIFNVDILGPEITQTTPLPGQIVGGIVKISAQVVDGAGVNESSVQALVGDKTTPQFKLALTREGQSDTFSVLFDSRLLTSCSLTAPLCIVRPSISFRAADLLGNDRTVAYEFALDNIPPIADLAPPPIRDSKRQMGLRCSILFDPLDHNTRSGDAPDDLCTVPQMFDLRARIQDDGNDAHDIKQVPVSLVDEDATAVYVLDAPSATQPLVVDTDGDGYCDAVNPKLEPTTLPLSGPRQVLKIRMKPVPPAGKADFTTDPKPLPPGCLEGIDPDVPDDLCGGSQPTLAISYLIDQPAIWSIEPIAPADPRYCFGSQFDALANNVTAAMGTAGWKCIAVVTADRAGNTSTSAPLRVHLSDYEYGGTRAFCANNGVVTAALGQPPSCTGTYDKVTQTVSQTACKTRAFKPGEICYNRNCDYHEER
jgi:hypothetical protein